MVCFRLLDVIRERGKNSCFLPSVPNLIKRILTLLIHPPFIFVHADFLDLPSFSRLLIHVHAYSVELPFAFVDLETGRKLGLEFIHDRIALHAQDAFLGSHHPGIRNVCRSSREYGIVIALDVGVRADHHRGTAFQMPSHGNFLRGRLSMKIHKDAFMLLAQFIHDVIGGPERAINGWQECPSLQIHDRQLFAVRFNDGVSAAGCAGREIRRANHARFVVDKFKNILVIPRVVSQGDAMNAPIEKFIGYGRGDAAA